MSRYSQAQEYRLIKHLKKYGWTIIEYYGSRRKNKGDVLASIGDILIRFDHKSTRSRTKIGFNLEWLTSLDIHCDNSFYEDGFSHPAISVSYLDCRTIYVGTPLYAMLNEPPNTYDWWPNITNELWVKELELCLQKGVYAIDSKFGEVYFYSLETFTKQLRK